MHRTSIGQRAKQYCLLLATSTGQIIDQYWSHHPFLRVWYEAYVYEGIVRDALRGQIGRRAGGVLGGEDGDAGLFLQPLDAGGILLDEVCPVLRGAR